MQSWFPVSKKGTEELKKVTKGQQGKSNVWDYHNIRKYVGIFRLGKEQQQQKRLCYTGILKQADIERLFILSSNIITRGHQMKAAFSIHVKSSVRSGDLLAQYVKQNLVGAERYADINQVQKIWVTNCQSWENDLGKYDAMLSTVSTDGHCLRENPESNTVAHLFLHTTEFPSFKCRTSRMRQLKTP